MARNTVCRSAQGDSSTWRLKAQARPAGTRHNQTGNCSTLVAIARSNCLGKKPCVVFAQQHTRMPPHCPALVVRTTTQHRCGCHWPGQRRHSHGGAAVGGILHGCRCTAWKRPYKPLASGYYCRTGQARANANTDDNAMSRNRLAQNSVQPSDKTAPADARQQCAAKPLTLAAGDSVRIGRCPVGCCWHHPEALNGSARGVRALSQCAGATYSLRAGG